MKMSLRFVNTFFNRFFEKTIDNVSYERMVTMNATDRKLLRDRKYVMNGNLEQKLMLLAKCGKPFVVIVGDSAKRHSREGLKRLIDLFYKRGYVNMKDGVDELKQGGFFFISDVDVVKSCNLLSNVYNDPVLHGIVSDFSEINKKLYARHTLESKSEKELTALYDLDKLISRLFAAALSPKYMKVFKAKTKLTAKEYRVLSVISKYRAIKLPELIKVVDTTGTTTIVEELKKRGLVSWFGDHKKIEVLIEGYGEVILSEARNFLLSEVY